MVPEKLQGGCTVAKLLRGGKDVKDIKRKLVENGTLSEGRRDSQGGECP